MTTQRRPVTDQPGMAVRVEKAALPMRSPRYFVVSHRIVVVRPRCCGPPDKRVWIVHEHLDPHCRGAKHNRALPAVAFWLGEKERRPLDLQADDRAEIPKLDGAESALVPGRCRRSTASIREMTFTRRTIRARQARSAANRERLKRWRIMLTNGRSAGNTRAMFTGWPTWYARRRSYGH